MQKIIYTVCSANHLAFAKTMVHSFLRHHPDYRSFICLTDKIAGRFNADDFAPATIVELENIGIESLKQMSTQYSIIELNCAVKPFMALYLIENYHPQTLIYADSDLFFYQRISSVEQDLINNNILLTPHILTPYNDDADPKERDMLRSGIFNAGFIGMKITGETMQFLNWWADRMKTQCYYNFELGMAVDQNWLNLVPLFFSDVVISHNKGLNVAYWNLHERKLSINNKTVVVNNDEPLMFFHFSGYKLAAPNTISVHQNRVDMATNSVLQSLFNDYRKAALDNGYSLYHALPCYYAKPPRKSMGILATANKFLRLAGIEIKKVH